MSGSVSGQGQPPKKIGMTCEVDKCNEPLGHDYKRIAGEIDPGWKDEPIFLCATHSKGRTPIEIENILK